MSRITAALVVMLVVSLAACAPVVTHDADSGNLADGKYLGDLGARGVPTGVTNGAPPGLGHAICTDMAGGSTAPTKLMQVANLQQNHQDQFTLQQAEMIVYWAVTELCPQYSSQLQDTWADGT